MTALRIHRLEHDSPLGRWTFYAACPTGSMADHVELFWTLEARDAYSREWILPRSSTELMFNLAGEPACLHGDDGSVRRFATSWIAGLQQRPLDVESHPDARMAAIRFRPAGVLPFLGLPPAELTGRVVELADVLGPSVHELRERLAAASPERRLALLARTVEARLGAGYAPRAEVRRALSAIGGSGGQVAVRELVAESGFSHRSFSRRFHEEVGLRPKVFARVVRFEAAVARLRRPPVSWAEFALDHGYFDQAHMIREFRELAGATPAQVARRMAPDGLGLLDD